METVSQILEAIKKPLEFALRDPGNIKTIKNLEGLVNSQLNKLFSKYKFRLSVEMLLQDLRYEFKGFDRFDSANKQMIVESAQRIITKIEEYIERGEDVLLDESEIARQRKQDSQRERQPPAARKQRQRRPSQKDAGQKRRGGPQASGKGRGTSGKGSETEGTPAHAGRDREDLKFRDKVQPDKPSKGSAHSGQKGTGRGGGQKKKRWTQNRRKTKKHV